MLFTNGTTRTPADYAQLLRAVGFDLGDDAVLTPVSSAVDLFVQRGHRKVMVLGGPGLTRPLADAGIETTPPVSGSGADAVLVGWYREVTFADIEAACDAVWHGARFYSSSQALFFATAEGRALGTPRAISAAVRDLTDCPVEVVGKPALHALQTAAHRLVAPTHDVVVVGDDPELEVPMAHAAGALVVPVATGLADGSAFDDLPPRNDRTSSSPAWTGCSPCSPTALRQPARVARRGGSAVVSAVVPPGCDPGRRRSLRPATVTQRTDTTNADGSASRRWGHRNAEIPVTARPTISELISRVPSKL